MCYIPAVRSGLSVVETSKKWKVEKENKRSLSEEFHLHGVPKSCCCVGRW